MLSDPTNKIVISYLQALREILPPTLFYALSRLLPALAGLINSIILSHVSDEAAQANVLITGSTACFLGFVRNILVATGTKTAGLKEEGKASQAGSFIANGWGLAILCSFGLIPLFLSAGEVLQATGIIEKEVAEQVTRYYEIFVLAVPFILGSAVDQSFIAHIKPKVTTLSTLVSAATAVAVGGSLALGVGGLTPMGIRGIAWGWVAASLSNTFFQRFYLLTAEFEEYALFKIQFEDQWQKFKNLLKLGLPMGLLSVVDWGSWMVLLLMVASKGHDALLAMAPISQITSIFLMTIHSVNSIVGGKIKKTKAAQEGEFINLTLRRLASAAYTIGIHCAVLFSGISVIFPHALTKLCVNKPSSEVLTLAQAGLFINAIGMLFDAWNNISIGLLRGLQDVNFAPLINFLSISLFGLAAGGGLSLLLDWGADWLFITRDLSILFAAIMMAKRWLEKTSVAQESLPLFATKKTPSRWYDLWKNCGEQTTHDSEELEINYTR